ncbi:MAG: hypothetical protein IIX85_07940 [Clostridia bacterium]|nr:hypothetical protein [Clostridia bacterium]
MLQTKKHTTMGALRTVVLLFLSATLLFLSACTPQEGLSTDDVASGSDLTDISATTDSSETTDTFDPSGGVTMDMGRYDYEVWYEDFLKNRPDAEWYLPANPSSADHRTADMTMSLAEIQRILRKEQPLTAEQQAYLNRYSSDDRGVRAIHPDHLRVPTFDGVSLSPKEPATDGLLKNNYSFQGESYTDSCKIGGYDSVLIQTYIFRKIPSVQSLYQSLMAEREPFFDAKGYVCRDVWDSFLNLTCSFSGYSATMFEDVLHQQWFRDDDVHSILVEGGSSGKEEQWYTYILDLDGTMYPTSDSDAGNRPLHIGSHMETKSRKTVEEEHRTVHIIRQSEYHLKENFYVSCVEFCVDVLIEYDDGSHVGFRLSGSRELPEGELPLEFLRVLQERWLSDEILLRFDSIPLSAQNADSATE